MDNNESIQEDIELVRQIAAGAKAEEYLSRKYREKISFLAKRKLHAEKDVEDICQETIVAVIIAARGNQIKGTNKLFSFIYSVCTNKINDKLRKIYGRKEEPINDNEEGDFTSQLESDELDKLELGVETTVIMQHLDTEEKVIIKLAFFHEWKSQEIGELLDQSDDVIRQKKKRILENIKKNIKGKN